MRGEAPSPFIEVGSVKNHDDGREDEEEASTEEERRG